MTDSAILKRWRTRCAKLTHDNDDRQYGASLAVDRTESCFRAEHAVKVLETTPATLVDEYQREGFDVALQWLREEVERGWSPVARLAPDGTPSLLPALPGVEVAREHEAHAPELGQVPESLHHELLEPPGVVTVPAGVDMATVGLEFPDLPLLPAEGTSPLD